MVSMRRFVGIFCVFSLLVGCGTTSKPANMDAPRVAKKGLAGSARTPEGIILRVKTVERLSDSEAKLNVELFHPGAVPIPQIVGPSNFFVAPQSSSAVPTMSTDLGKSSLKKITLAPREEANGEVILKLPTADAYQVYYGATPEVSVRAVAIPAK
jgi:hypothetical protein